VGWWKWGRTWQPAADITTTSAARRVLTRKKDVVF